MINFEKDHVVELLKKDKRMDGRGLLDYREISLEKGFTKSAEGSARVKIGKTDVMVGIKMSLDTPYGDTPESGNLMVNAEFLAMSSPKFEPGPPGIDAIELARVVDRGIREAKTIDVKNLCLIPGEKVWSVSIDVCTINVDGNLMDAAALAAIAALQDTRLPELDENNIINYSKHTDKGLPLEKDPVGVTVLKLGDKFIVDPLESEEEAADARLTVCSTSDGRLCAMQKGGEGPLSTEDISKMIELGIEKASELRKFL